MPITINGSGTLTGLSAGGLPDSSITSDDIASAAVTPAKLSTGAPSWTSGGDLSFNSGYGSVATAYGCRAWVNFNGTGTVAIRASGNVSSITDRGTGSYRVNFTSAMPDANFCTAASTNNVSVNTNFGINVNTPTTAKIDILCIENGADTDKSEVNVAIFR